MTVFGKILVLVNLVFSLVVGGLIVVFSASYTNAWGEYKKKDEQYQVARKAADVYREDSARAATEANAKVDAAGKEVVKANARADEEKKNSDRKDLMIADRDRKIIDSGNMVSLVQAENVRRQKENAILEDAIKQRDTKNAQLLAEFNKEHQTSVTLKIERDSLLERNRVMLVQLQDMQKERLRTGSTGAGALASGSNPPPENVEGVIKEIDRQQGLVALTIGSDSGLQEGHTVEAFRPNINAPEQSKYLGSIRILKVRAKESVGRPEKPVGLLQVGDRVAGKLGG